MFSSDIDIYFINLEEDQDRLDRVYENLKNKGFNLSKVFRIDAIKHDIGMIGCAASHVKALEKFSNESDSNFAIILEDDFRFSISSEVLIDIFDTISKHDKHWHVWQLYASSPVYRTFFKTKKLYFENFEIVRIIESNCCAAYLLKKEYSKLLASRFKRGYEVFKINQSYYKNKRLFISHRDKFSTDQVWKELQGLGHFIGVDAEIGRLQETYSRIKMQQRSYSDGSIPKFLGMGKII